MWEKRTNSKYRRAVSMHFLMFMCIALFCKRGFQIWKGGKLIVTQIRDLCIPSLCLPDHFSMCLSLFLRISRCLHTPEEITHTGNHINSIQHNSNYYIDLTNLSEFYQWPLIWAPTVASHFQPPQLWSAVSVPATPPKEKHAQETAQNSQ